MAKKPDPATLPDTEQKARRVPLEPVDFFGRPVQRWAPRADLVEGWKQAALAAANTQARADRQSAVGVRVTVGFVLLALAVGSPFGVVGALASLLTLGSMLLAQELPGALLARLTRHRARIVITAKGSRTEHDAPPFALARGFSVALGGSLLNALIAHALYAIAASGVVGKGSAWLEAAALAHALWGVLQILPLLPFRAGWFVAKRLTPPIRLLHAALSITCVTAAGLYALHGTAAPLAFVAFVFTAGSTAAALRDAATDWSDDVAGVASLARSAEAHLHADAPEAAVEQARQALDAARGDALRIRLCKTLAWAAIGKSDPFLAHAALGQLPSSDLDVHLVTAYLACCNRTDEAVRLLQEARAQGQRTPETTRLLLELLVRQGAVSEAWAVARADRAILSVVDWTAIESALGASFVNHGTVQ